MPTRREYFSYVSMCPGDAGYKPYISGEPDVETVKYEAGDWLVLACDGLWDQLTPDDVVELLNDDSDESRTPAQRLVRAAKDGGSTDNITAIAVRLFPLNAGEHETTTPTDPNRTAEVETNRKNDDGKTEPRTNTGTEAERSGDPPVGRETVEDSTTTSRLAVSMKRLADAELDVSDDEKLTDLGPPVGQTGTEDEELGAYVDSGSSSVDVQNSSSQDSRRNFLHLSREVGSLEDALLAAAAEFSNEFTSPSSSGPSDAMRTTSEDTSGQSPDPSVEAGTTEQHVASMQRNTKRRSVASWQRRHKENRRPSDDGDRPAETPPCLRAGSPLMHEEDLRQAASSLTESCCRSLSLPSGSGALLNVQHCGAAQRMAAAVRPVPENRGQIASINNPSRWTIAVEVDADGMFEEYPGIITSGPPSSAMNLSSHW